MPNQINNDESMLRIGTILHGVYRVDKYLSSGGFGKTYLTTRVDTGEIFAIKEFFLKDYCNREDDNNTVRISVTAKQKTFYEQMEKFKKEARRLQQLHNPHIVRVYDLFDENGTAYYVMDYVEGEDLRKRLKRTNLPLNEKEVIIVLRQLLDALQEVHDNSLWHLDLKPANIMMDCEGKVKIIDFGASKQLNIQKGGATSNSVVSYTKGYAPREQLEEKYEKIGPWTDFYALGATLYNLLTNSTPPMPSDIDDDISDDKHVALPFPSDVSQNMRNLILWLMKTHRMERPQNVEVIKNYVDTYLEEIPIPSHYVNNQNPPTHETFYIPNSTGTQDYASDETILHQEGDSTIPPSFNEPIDDDYEETSSVSYGKISKVFLILLSFCATIFLGFYLTKSLRSNEHGDKDSVTNKETTVPNIGSCLYSGSVDSNDLPHGEGTATFTDSKGNITAIFKGRFHHGNFEYGTYESIEMSHRFEGTFNNNYYSEGTLTTSDGYYKGSFHTVTRNGITGGQPYNGWWYTNKGKKDYQVVNGKE